MGSGLGVGLNWWEWLVGEVRDWSLVAGLGGSLELRDRIEGVVVVGDTRSLEQRFVKKRCRMLVLAADHGIRSSGR